MRKTCRSFLLTITYTLTLTTMASAQVQTSALTGVIRDATESHLAGVVVTVSSPQLIGGTRTESSDEQGRYSFTALTPGDYIITATSPGFQTLRRSGIELPPGYTLSVDLAMSVSAVEATVDVHNIVPVIDVRSSASPHVIERELLQNLPMLGRTLGEYLNLAPGVTAGVPFGGAAGTPAVAVDGTGGNDPAQGRGDAQPVVNWLDSLQVVSVGANAEHGEYTSARLNAITRSGGNRLSGLSDYWWTTPNWSRWGELLEWWDASTQVGGPVLRDRLWYFGGAEYFSNAWRPGGYGTGARSPDEPRATQRERKGILKLSGAITPAARLEGYLEGESVRSRNGNAGPSTRPEARASFLNDRRFQNLRATWVASSRTLIEAGYGRYSGDQMNGPDDPAGRLGPPPHRDQTTGVMSVNASNFSESARVVWSARATLQRSVDTNAGRHELKAGVEHERARLRDAGGYPGGALYQDRDGQPEFVWLWDGWNYRPSHHRTSAFLQDTWAFDRVTIEPGVRFGWYDSAVPQTTARLYSNHSIAPRVGVAWDVTKDHDTVLRAHYGHYYDPMATRLYESFDELAEGPFTVARVVGPSTFDIVSVTPAPSADNTRIDPAIGHSYAEEWSAGIERAVWQRLSLKAQYIRRHARNTMGFIDVGSEWTPVTAVDPGPDGRTGTPDDGASLTIFHNLNPAAASFVLTNPEGAWRHYDAIQLIAVQRASRGLALQMSYTWAHTRGSFDNDNGSNAANTDMARNGNFANPNRAINATGRTLYDRRHDVRVLGTYLLPYWGGVRVSGIYRLTSGAPWARLVNSFGPLTGANNIVVEPVGSRMLPYTSEVDLRAEKILTIRQVDISVYGDVFNATNRVVASRVNMNSGSAFGAVTGWTQGRRFRMGVRVSF
jgi:hypothetical protein